MSTFKVGDKVVRTGDTWCGVENGKEYTVSYVDQYGCIRLLELLNTKNSDTGYASVSFKLVHSQKFFDGYFKVNDEAHSKEIQEYLFSIGYSWMHTNEYFYCNASYLFISSLGRITFLCPTRDPSIHTKDLPEYVLNVEKIYTLKQVEKPQPAPETIEIGGIKYLKSDFENAVKGLTPC